MNSKHNIILACIALLLCVAFLGQPIGQVQAGGTGPLPEDRFWSTEYTLPGVNGNVLAIARKNGNIYVAGDFSTAGGVQAAKVAMFDGEQWHSLSNDTGGLVRSLAFAVDVDGTEKLFAAGDFTTIGTGGSINRLAAWDGIHWEQVGGGVDGEVYALAYDAAHSRLYVGGSFTHVGSTAAAGVARYNLTNGAWEAVATSISASGSVRSLVYAGDKLYVGGLFDSINGVAAKNIAVYDVYAAPVYWSALGNGLDALVSALVYQGGNLYAGGAFLHSGATELRHLAHWDGFNWSGVGSGTDGEVRALATDGTSLVVGGIFWRVGAGVFSVDKHLAIWDISKSAWMDIGSGTDEVVNAVVIWREGAPISFQQIVVGGSFSKVNGVNAAGVAKRTGTAWSALKDKSGSGTGWKGHLGPVEALASDSQGNVYLAWCDFQYDPGNRHNIARGTIERWDGVAWVFIGTPGGTNYGCLHTLTVGPDDTLYAGGAFSLTTEGPVTVGRVYKWLESESTWQQVGTDFNGQVDAIIVRSDNTLFAGGNFSKSDGGTIDHIARWDVTNQQWVQTGNGLNGPVYALAFHPVTNNLYAGGSFTLSGCGNIAYFDTTWHPLGTGTNGWINAIAVDNRSYVYVGGSFTQAGSEITHNVAYYLNNWHGMGDGLDGMVTSLALDGVGRVYAGGGFNQSGTRIVGKVARWSGSIWSDPWTALGNGPMSTLSNTNTQINALLPEGRAGMYVAGRFSIAGVKVANNITFRNETYNVYLPVTVR